MRPPSAVSTVSVGSLPAAKSAKLRLFVDSFLFDVMMLLSFQVQDFKERRRFDELLLHNTPG
jgi:hypothetical protein